MTTHNAEPTQNSLPEAPVNREQVLSEIRAASQKVNEAAAVLAENNKNLSGSIDAKKVEAVLAEVMDTLPEDEFDMNDSGTVLAIYEKCRGPLDDQTVDALIDNEKLTAELAEAMTHMQWLIEQHDLSEDEFATLLT